MRRNAWFRGCGSSRSGEALTRVFLARSDDAERGSKCHPLFALVRSSALGEGKDSPGAHSDEVAAGEEARAWQSRRLD